MANLLRWCDRLREKRITGRLILDGSFVAAKPDPADFDTILVVDEGVETILAQDAEADLPVGILVAYEEERVELGAAADFAHEGCHERPQDLYMTRLRHVKHRVEACLVTPHRPMATPGGGPCQRPSV